MIETHCLKNVGYFFPNNNKYIRDYDKNKELSNIQYWDANNLHGCAMSQMFPVNNFEWIKDIFHKKLQ